MAYLFLEKIILTNKIFLHFRHRYRQEHIQKQSITLSTKVHLVKAMVFPVVMYGWRRQWQPMPVFLPGESHGQRSLVGCSPWGRRDLGTTERLSAVYREQGQVGVCSQGAG